MTTITYSWNPFQDITSCDIKSEAITSQGGNRVIVIPRAAPFFAKNLVLRNAVNNAVLVEGVDYAFTYPFSDFIRSKSKLVYGGIVLLGNTGAMQLSLDYSTIGGPFVLDDSAWAQSVANISATPRTADWRDITNLPIDGFPPDPHEHPVNQTLDYVDMITVFNGLISSMNNETNNPTVQTQLVDHSGKTLAEAHGGATPKDVGLSNVSNYPQATEADLSGSSNERTMTVFTTRKLVTLMLKQAMSDYDPSDLPIVELENKLDDIVADALTSYGKSNPIVKSTGFDSNNNSPADVRNFVPNTTPSLIYLNNNLVVMIGEGTGTTSATATPGPGTAVGRADFYESTAKITYPKTFKNRPYCFASPFDGYGASGEFAFPVDGDTTYQSFRVGCNLPSILIPFTWIAIGVLNS